VDPPAANPDPGFATSAHFLRCPALEKEARVEGTWLKQGTSKGPPATARPAARRSLLPGDGGPLRGLGQHPSTTGGRLGQIQVDGSLCDGRRNPPVLQPVEEMQPGSADFAGAPNQAYG